MCRSLLLLATVSAAFAQIDSNVMTITASRQLNIQPDQISLAVTVSANTSQTLGNVVAALQGTGITATDLVSSQGNGAAQVQWVFNITVPLSAMQSTTAMLAALKPANGATVTYYVQGATASAQATAAQQCPYPALINDARTQAAKLATAAGLTVGPVVSMAQGSIQNSPALYAQFGAFLGVKGVVFDPTTSSVSSILISPPDSSCSLTVQFQVTQ